MYAIIETGGKQYKVSLKQSVAVEDLGKKPGEIIELDKVLFFADGEKFVVGTPYIKNAKVIAKVTEQDKARKIIVFKTKRKKNYRRKAGHRQSYSRLLIQDIKAA